jgi:hypothetical protein
VLLLRRELPQYRHLLRADSEQRVQALPEAEREELHRAVQRVLAAHPELEALLEDEPPPAAAA